MALVKCPECGREKVSDTAQSCPNCGFGIKEYFDNVRKEEEERKRLEQEKNERIKKQKEEKEKREKDRIEQEEKKQREIEEFEKRKKEREKNRKILRIIFIICAVILVIALIVSVRNQMKTNEINAKLSAYAEEQFGSDFDSYIQQMCDCGLDISASYEFSEGTYSKESQMLFVTCNIKYVSKDISSYKNIGYDSAEAAKLCQILMAMDSVEKESNREYTLDGVGKISVTLACDDDYYGITIYDENDIPYTYSRVVSYDEVKIDGEYVYMESDGSYKSSNNSNSSYSGSYDATLEYGSGSVLICISEDAMSRYMTALNKGNEGTIEEMQTNGEIAFTAKGTKCNIVERKATKYKVKLLDGDYAGNTVWVIIESVKEK